MRIALFATCLVDTLYPEVGKATVRLLRRLGHEVVFPEQQTCCGQMHVNTGYQREAVPLVRNYVETFAAYDAIVAPSGSCVGSRPPPARRWSPGAPATSLADAAEAVAARTYELSELLVDVLGRRRRGRVLTRTGSPTTRPATRCGCCGSATGRCGCCAGCAASTSSSCPTPSQCCGFGGTFSVKNADMSTAMLTDKMATSSRPAPRCARPATLLPDAHRRRAVPAASRASDRAPRRDPRRRPSEPAMSTFLGMPTAPPGRACCAGDEPFPAAARDARSATRSCGATSATPRDDPRQAGAASSARCPTGRSCATAGRGDQGTPRMRAPRPATSMRAGGSRSPRAAARCTGRATPTRPTRSSPTWSGDRRRRGRQGQVDGHPGDRPQRGARGRRASRRTRPTWPS